MLGMEPQVCAWLEVMIIIVQIRVMSLKIQETEDDRDSPRKWGTASKGIFEERII